MRRLLIVAVAMSTLSGCGSSPEEVCQRMTALHTAEDGPEPPADAETQCVSQMEKAKDDANMFAWANFTRCVDKVDTFDDVSRLCAHKL